MIHPPGAAEGVIRQHPRDLNHFFTEETGRRAHMPVLRSPPGRARGVGRYPRPTARDRRFPGGGVCERCAAGARPAAA